VKRRRGSEGFKEQREAHLSKGSKLLEELRWRAHLLERRRAHGWRQKLEHGFLEMKRAQGFKEGALSCMRAIMEERGARA
jgi:hypothetical protein